MILVSAVSAARGDLMPRDIVIGLTSGHDHGPLSTLAVFYTPYYILLRELDTNLHENHGEGPY